MLKLPPPMPMRPMTLSWLKLMWSLNQTVCLKPMRQLLLKHLLCSLKPQLLPLLLFCHQGHTLLSKHFIKARLSLSDGQFWFLRPLPDHGLIIMWSTCLRFRSQSRGCQGFQVLHLRQDRSMLMASLHITPSSIEPRTHIPSQEYHLVGSGVIHSAAITLVFYTIKGTYFPICVWTAKPLLACPA